MENIREVRSLAVCAHVDHGKTTLTDALVKRAGLSNKDNALDHVRPDQVERNITIKSTGAALVFPNLLVNLIDSPGHVDFSPEVTAALRLTDGVILVVDVASGVKVQTQTVLKQALSELVRPVLVLNKLDRLFAELKMTPDEAYIRLSGIIDQVNGIMETYAPEGFPHIPLSPLTGNVLFASGKQAWGFSLPQIAGLYGRKTGKGAADVLATLWGDMFQDPLTKKWGRRLSAGRVRGFCRYVLEPVMALYAGERGALETLGVDATTLKKEVPLLAATFPLADALLELIGAHLPSPSQAQRYRGPHLYPGPPDDPVAKGIAECDPAGPLCIYICKCVPAQNNVFWAFGRVLSGTVTRNQRVNILTGADTDPAVCVAVQQVAAPRGAEYQALDGCSAGSLVCLTGVDKHIVRTATIVEASNSSLLRVREMKFSVSPVVAVSVRPKNQKDLAAFQTGLARLSKVDQLVSVRHDPNTGEIVIAGAGELHLEILLHDLREFSRGVELVVGQPVVALRETVSERSGQPALAKSSNKLNRVFASAQPVEPGFLQHMLDLKIPPEQKERAALFHAHPEWNIDAKAPKKLWVLGGSQVEKETGPNLLTDATRGVDYLNEAQNYFVTSFKKFALSGPLCGEPLHGVHVTLDDVKLHSDSAHRGAGELLEACRRSFSGAVLTAGPRVCEPIMLVTIELPSEMANKVYGFVAQRRGLVLSETHAANGAVSLTSAHIPALECFGLDAALRAQTSGHAFCVIEFAHWQVVDSDPLDENTFAHKLVRERRAQKQLPEKLDVASFIDRL